MLPIKRANMPQRTIKEKYTKKTEKKARYTSEIWAFVKAPDSRGWGGHKTRLCHQIKSVCTGAARGQGEAKRGEAASRSESEAFWLKSSGCCCVAQLGLSATKTWWSWSWGCLKLQLKQRQLRLLQICFDHACAPALLACCCLRVITTALRKMGRKCNWKSPSPPPPLCSSLSSHFFGQCSRRLFHFSHMLQNLWTWNVAQITTI